MALRGIDAWQAEVGGTRVCQAGSQRSSPSKSIAREHLLSAQSTSKLGVSHVSSVSEYWRYNPQRSASCGSNIDGDAGDGTLLRYPSQHSGITASSSTLHSRPHFCRLTRPKYRGGHRRIRRHRSSGTARVRQAVFAFSNAVPRGIIPKDCLLRLPGIERRLPLDCQQDVASLAMPRNDTPKNRAQSVKI